MTSPLVCIFVNGTLRTLVEGKSFDIDENEFLQVQANCSHEYRCLGSNMAAALMQIRYLS
jgi:mannose-6-phosphate isomerase-like protein (cupin superfamily)